MINRDIVGAYFSADSGHGSLASPDDAVSAVPEPPTWAMLLMGFAGVGVMAYMPRQPRSALA